MAKRKDTTRDPVDKPHSERRGWKLAKVGTLIASLAGTAALHLGIHEKGGDADDHLAIDTSVTVPVRGEMRTVERTGGKLVEGPREEAVTSTKTDEKNETIPGSEYTESSTYPVGGETDWSEQFAESATATEVSQSAIEQTEKTIETLKQQGYTAFVVEVQGMVSAEDNTPAEVDGGHAGLQVVTEGSDNDILGDVRGGTHTAVLAENFVSDESVEIIQGDTIEQVATDGEVLVLDTMSQQFGYDSVKTMIQHWNRSPKDVPPAVNDVLQSLVQHRGVQVTITATRPATEEESVTHTIDEEPATDMICVTTIREVRLEPTQERGPDREVEIPVVVPWVVLIPIVRRRSEKEERQAHMDERIKAERKSRHKQDLALLTSLLRSNKGSGGTVSGDSEGSKPGGDPEPEGEPTHTPPQGEPTPPEGPNPPEDETIVDPPQEPEEKKRRKWPLIFVIPVVLYAAKAGLDLTTNHPANSEGGASAPRPSEAITCEPGLEKVFEIQRADGTTEYLKEGERTKDSSIIVREDGRIVFVNEIDSE